ncbi:unnamed protein product [Ranitomeya imitator]|uniref:Phosphatidylinositol 5-phosphate 4-kinase type-2 gamma n=1 Tax=Ranitomeya imitator TaxID=111125 RepID=A0ABN9LJ21_9NEOB|nr:unnamed protein product [Ranitomeya imitator]
MHRLNLVLGKENLPSHFKFKEYCPQVFRNLRERFGIDDIDYQITTTANSTMGIREDMNDPPRKLTRNARRGLQTHTGTIRCWVSLTRSSPYTESEAHDGRFLLAYDRTLAVKEISSEDVADMHSILSDYHQHIVKCHGSTLLPQFLGMYRLSVDNEDSYMLVMRNMFSHRLTVHRKYDLKGAVREKG